MLDKLKSTISTVVHNIFGPNKTSSESTYLVIPEVYDEHIESYFQRLGIVNHLFGTDRLKDWRVVEVKYFMTISRHEYMQACVVCPNKKKTYLAFMRIRGNHVDSLSDLAPGDSNHISPSDTDSDLTLQLVSSSKSSISSAPESLPPNRTAHDWILPLPWMKRWCANNKLLLTLTFPSSSDTSANAKRPLFFYELAILASIVHEADPSYLLLSNNRYHYAGTIIKILEDEYTPTITAKTRRSANADVGKWCGINIYGRNEGGIPSLRAKFNIHVKDFWQEGLNVTKQRLEAENQRAGVEVENQHLRSMLAAKNLDQEK